MNNKRVLVTGGLGFVGFALVNALLDSGCKVYTVIKEKSTISRFVNHSNLTVIECSPEDVNSLTEKISENIDVAYHIAWSGSSGSTRGDYRIQLDNVSYSLDLIHVLSKLNCKRFIGIGSVAEFICKTGIFTDRLTASTTNHYGIAKVAAHYMTQAECNTLGIDHIWVYLPNVYGAGDTTGNFINNTIAALMSDKRAQFTSGVQLDDFTYITDVIQGLILLGTRGEPFNSYYLGYGKSQTVREYIEIIRDEINPKIPLYFGEIPFHGITLPKEIYDCSKLAEHTGYKPLTSFEQGIKLTIAESKRNQRK